ncbi:MAG TPA: hypothetical protein VF857_11215, partial [Spirochaetota bacterium]
MTKILFNKKANEVFLRITGQGDVSHIIKIRNYLVTLLSGDFSACHIDLSGLSEMDISFAQLMISFRN